MPLSTFSFDPTVAWKTLIGGALTSGTVVMLYLSSGLGEYNDRITKPLGILPEISNTSERKKVIVYGSSMTQYGFDPLVFDRTTSLLGASTVSYNFGVPNVDPGYQEVMTRRIREFFEDEQTELDLVLVEFNPFQTTMAREARSFISRDQNQAVLFNHSEMWQVVKNDPARGIRLFNIRYLRDGVSAEMLTSFASFMISRRSPSLAFRHAQRDRSVAEERFEQLRNRDTGEGFHYWNEHYRGGRNDKEQFKPDTLLALKAWSKSQRHPAFLRADLDNRIRQADILGLEFSERLSDAFIQMVHNFQAISHHVEVILMPRNTAWVNYDHEAQSRLNRLLARIERETGARVRDFQEMPSIEVAHFRDTTHLSTYDGAEIFSIALAKQYGPLLTSKDN